MDWNVGSAKQRFSEVVRAAEQEPQMIYNRDKLVAAVVNAESWEAFRAWREAKPHVSLADAFRELRTIAEQENYELEVPERQNRRNVFPDVLR